MIIEVTPDEFWSRPEVPGLIDGYAAECHTAGLPPPRPDMALYKAMYDIGCVRVLIAITDDKMVGFVVVLISPVAHYSAKLAVSESFYVAPEARAEGVGTRLRWRAEALAQEAGAAGMFVSAPAGGVLEQVMRKTKSYRHTNTVFFKSLGE